MSVYVTVECSIQDVDLLMQALDAVGIEYKHYPQRDGVYRKWRAGDYYNMQGRVRGTDAVVVIHGGLDTTTGGRFSRYCGDTAFVQETDGLKVKLDIAHNNAAANWEAIQAEYNALNVEARAKAAGVRVERVVDERGKIRLRVHQRPQRNVGRRTVQRRA